MLFLIATDRRSGRSGKNNLRLGSTERRRERFPLPISFPPNYQPMLKLSRDPHYTRHVYPKKTRNTHRDKTTWEIP